MLIKAMELAKDNGAIELNKWLQASEFNPIEKVSAIKNIFDKLAIPDLLNEEVKYYANLAWQAFEQVDATASNKEIMADFMNGLLAREV